MCTFEFLPANSTSVLQPLDQGIIQTVEHMYGKPLVSRLLQRMTTKTVYSVSLLDAIHMLATSWDSLSQETIANCFRKAGISTVPEDLPVVSLDTVEESDSIWAEVKERLGITSTFNDYVKEDDNLPPCEVQEIENFCKSSEDSSMEQLGQPCDANENDCEHNEENDALKPVTCSEAMQHLEAYSCSLSNVPDVPENIMKILWELESYTAILYGKKSKQTTLDKFFSI
ncbi:hypothetical protein PR048_016079 [Dryococelus australis]|uniref:DDE-1 domain-containing protein n=1 Tax=Dryococelus australis TaxID=614101 RepID=A0ABQ9HIR4_9NEOP|nr:hypothetical protein PR048_016079 [Dryococelus australis]